MRVTGADRNVTSYRNEKAWRRTRFQTIMTILTILLGEAL